MLIKIFTIKQKVSPSVVYRLPSGTVCVPQRKQNLHESTHQYGRIRGSCWRFLEPPCSANPVGGDVMCVAVVSRTAHRFVTGVITSHRLSLSASPHVPPCIISDAFLLRGMKFLAGCCELMTRPGSSDMMRRLGM